MRATSERRERGTRTERAGAAARERACGGVRGAKPLGSEDESSNSDETRCAQRASAASEARERSAPAQRRARERVGESEGRSPSDRKMNRATLTKRGARNERAPRAT